MQRYNIAYYPSSPYVAQATVAYAQRHFALHAADYLLDGRAAYPHVTLCQFEAEESALPDLWDKAMRICAPQTALTLGRLCFYPAIGKLWAAFGVTPLRSLMDDQAKIVALVAEQGLAPLTAAGEHYFPHLTLAELKRNLPPPALTAWPDTELWGLEQAFHLTLGRSDANGVYQEKLFSV